MAKTFKRKGGHGAGHFVGLRLSAMPLVLLGPWFAIAAAFALRDGGYDAALAFLSTPLNAVLTALLVVIGLYHMSLGMEEVILDYIHKPGTRGFLKFLNIVAPLLVGAAALYALYSLNFGA